LRYRAEIDGLRAVAVVPVILFHAGFSLFGGGFVGVDVFFVISGYLITSIILGEIQAGSFSVVNFYERRARRILPALFVVVLVCIPVAWTVLIPKDLRDFAQSLVAVSTFSSNILFWRQSGYFATAAELVPLLHTWSLAVEEQYYILFPLFFVLAWRFGVRVIVIILLATFVFSLGLSHWATFREPAAAFYLLPTRGWEILLGALIAFYLNRYASPHGSKHLHQLLSAAGLILIIYAAFAFNEQTPFPGLSALIPTIGTSAIILFAVEGTVVRAILSNRALVGMGLISYSAYLWHQPLFAFTKYHSLDNPSFATMLALCLVTLPLAYLSWRFVETPFRKGHLLSRTRLFSAATIVAASLIVLGLAGHFTIRPMTEIQLAGSKVEIPRKFLGIVRDGKNCSSPSFDPPTVCSLNGTFPERRTIVLIGDSHARVFSEALEMRPDLYSEFIDLTASGCAFLPGLSRYILNDPHDCTSAYQEERIRYLKSLKSDNIVFILVARLPLYYYGTGFDNTVGGYERRNRTVFARSPSQPDTERQKDFMASLEQSIAFLASRASQVIIVKPTHTNGWNPIDRAVRLAKTIATRRELEDALAIPLGPVLERSGRLDRALSSLAGKYKNVATVDPKSITCDTTQNACFGFRNGKFLFTDVDHLSLETNLQIIGEIASILDR
jgi:peptidoglycan/LPS O-acetylase OafA/YrhL